MKTKGQIAHETLHGVDPGSSEPATVVFMGGDAMHDPHMIDDTHFSNMLKHCEKDRIVFGQHVHRLLEERMKGYKNMQTNPPKIELPHCTVTSGSRSIAYTPNEAGKAAATKTELDTLRDELFDKTEELSEARLNLEQHRTSALELAVELVKVKEETAKAFADRNTARNELAAARRDLETTQAANVTTLEILEQVVRQRDRVLTDACPYDVRREVNAGGRTITIKVVGPASGHVRTGVKVMLDVRPALRIAYDFRSFERLYGLQHDARDFDLLGERYGRRNW